MQTALCDMLGVEIPIVLAPMGRAVGPRLTAAVCNAGALGSLQAWRADVGTLRGQLREIRSLTSRPFAANLNLAFPAQAERLDACLDEGVPVISLFWGDPSLLAPRAKAAGAIVMQTVASADEARVAVGCGADVVVAQGWEAGGHVWGTVATMALTPVVVDAVAPAPVVAAGGIADGRGLAAALALGAAGAWIGTRFLASAEAEIHPRYRERLLGARETDTVHLEDLFGVGWPDAPHRALRNETVDAWEAAGRPTPGARPGEGEIIAHAPSGGPMVRYGINLPTADAEGDIDALAMWAGQGVGLVTRVQPAGEIVREIAGQADAILRRLGSAAA